MMDNEDTVPLSTPPSTSWVRGTVVGVATLVALTALKLAFADSIGRPTPFLMYFGAVLVAAWYGGAAAGLVTTAISAVLGYVGFIEDPAHSDLGRVAAQLAIFCVEGFTISWITGRLSQEQRKAWSAAAEARDAAAKLEVVLHEVDVGITMQDPEGTLVYANAMAARILGASSPADLVGVDGTRVSAPFEVFDETGVPIPPERMPNRIVRAGGTPEEILVQFETKGRADVRWSIVGASAVRAEDGELRSIVNVFRDVTERHRQQEALRISREWFSTALRSIGDAVIATDNEGHIGFMNPCAESITGWSMSECEGKPLSDVFRILHEVTRVPSECPVERVLREGKVVGLAKHTVLVRKDGSEVAIDDSAAPIRGTDGVLVGVVLVFRDVSVDRRRGQRSDVLSRASAELGSSLEYASTLAALARIAVPHIADWCAVDIVEDGVLRRLAVAHVDPAKVAAVEEIERRWPTDPRASTGVPNVLRTGEPEMISVIPPELIEAAALDAEHLEVIRALELRSYIAVPLSRAGKTFGVITLAMAESQRTYGPDDLEFAMALAERAAIAVENARLYRAAETARGDAELANRAKDDFLAMLGHELRNPLAPILTALELMKLRSPDGMQRERDIIERQVRSVVRLVDDLLDMSRITRGRVELTKVPVDLADVVAKGLEVAAPLVESRRHQVEVTVPRGLVVDGDAARLAQVVANLLTNAAKYTEPHGRIRIFGERDDASIVLRVADSGIGIAPQMLSRIFEVFVQEPQAIDRAQGGLGLGLTIVQSLVRLHGGSVTAGSAGPGCGSEFVVTLPASTGQVREPAEIDDGQSTATRAVSVLVVDDNVDALEMLVEALQVLGHRPHPACDGPSALTVAASTKPAIALLDLGLPGLDGYEVGRRLQAMPELDGIKLVAITGYGQASDRERTAAAGFAAHLVKPVRLDMIRAIIEELTV